MAPFRNDREAADVPTPKYWYRGKKLLAFPALVIGVFVGLPAMGNLAASSCGYRAAVIEAAQSCPEARELLGDDIRFGYVGLACGTTSINDRDVGYDYASWRMPIRGSESSGVYHFNVEDHGRGWSMGAGRIEADGRTIELSECSADSQAASNGKSIAEVLIATVEEAHTGTAIFDGKVKASTHPNVKAGATCNGTMTMRGTKKPSSMNVKCDGITIYEGEGLFAKNFNDANNPDDDILIYTDSKTTPEDETPAVSMMARTGKADGESGLLTVNDVEAGNIPMFEVIISL